MFEDTDNSEYKKENERIRNLPILKKADEIFKLVESIIVTIDSFKDNKTMFVVLDSMKPKLYQDSVLLKVKISGAEAGGLYEIKMANAAIIRSAAMSLSTHCTGLEIYGYKFEDYTNLLRNEIEEFRLLFLDWISTFDITLRGIDRWGMFNPPGVDPNEEDDMF